MFFIFISKLFFFFYKQLSKLSNNDFNGPIERNNNFHKFYFMELFFNNSVSHFAVTNYFVPAMGTGLEMGGKLGTWMGGHTGGGTLNA